MRRRNEHATHRRAVAGVSVGIEHQVGHARRAARVECLLDALRIERIANRGGANHRDRFALVARRGNETGGFAR